MSDQPAIRMERCRRCDGELVYLRTETTAGGARRVVFRCSRCGAEVHCPEVEGQRVVRRITE